jgi:membrane fusion protein (multidrug efflux system)
MAANFSSTIRALQADQPHVRVLPLFLAALVAGCAAWFFLGQIGVYEVTEQARLESPRTAHPVATQVAGQVVTNRLTIGREVEEGDELVELNAEAERRALQEKKTRRDGLIARGDALKREIQLEQEALGAEARAATAALAESKALIEKAGAQARFAEIQLQILEKLRTRQDASELEFRKALAEAEMSRVAVQVADLAVKRLELDRQVQESDRKTRIAKLARQQVELEREQAVEEAGIQRLEYEVSLRTIRAPVGGRVEEVVDFPAGSTVRAAEKLGVVVPGGRPRVVAWFPSAAVGRVRAGQRAWVRLTGFAWTQYGKVSATVTQVGNEPNGARIRAELDLNADVPAAIPIEHGLPGSAEVEVERVPPALLVIRAAGQFLRTRPAADTPDTVRGQR